MLLLTSNYLVLVAIPKVTNYDDVNVGIKDRIHEKNRGDNFRGSAD